MRAILEAVGRRHDAPPALDLFLGGVPDAHVRLVPGEADVIGLADPVARAARTPRPALPPIRVVRAEAVGAVVQKPRDGGPNGGFPAFPLARTSAFFALLCCCSDRDGGSSRTAPGPFGLSQAGKRGLLLPDGTNRQGTGRFPRLPELPLPCPTRPLLPPTRLPQTRLPQTPRPRPPVRTKGFRETGRRLRLTGRPPSRLPVPQPAGRGCCGR